MCFSQQLLKELRFRVINVVELEFFNLKLKLI
jgi:hypothetical protein